MIIFPDVRGLYRFYVELAERFAEAGHHAIVFDYFGRTAGTGERDAEWEYLPHVEQTVTSQIQADADAARAALAERTGATSFVSVGFCFGGAQSFLAATSQELLLDGAVGFYGLLAGGRFGMPAGSTTSARRAARSSGCSAATTRRSRRATSTPTTGCSARPRSSTRSSSTPARRTRSSTAPTRSTRARAPTRGGG